jgi:hypothetical protein
MRLGCGNLRANKFANPHQAFLKSPDCTNGIWAQDVEVRSEISIRRFFLCHRPHQRHHHPLGHQRGSYHQVYRSPKVDHQLRFYAKKDWDGSTLICRNGWKLEGKTCKICDSIVTVRHTIGQKCSTRSLKVPIVFLFLWLSVVSWIDFWPIMA